MRMVHYISKIGFIKIGKFNLHPRANSASFRSIRGPLEEDVVRVYGRKVVVTPVDGNRIVSLQMGRGKGMKDSYVHEWSHVLLDFAS